MNAGPCPRCGCLGRRVAEGAHGLVEVCDSCFPAPGTVCVLLPRALTHAEVYPGREGAVWRSEGGVVEHRCPKCGGLTVALATVDPATLCGRCQPSKGRGQREPVQHETPERPPIGWPDEDA